MNKILRLVPVITGHNKVIEPIGKPQYDAFLIYDIYDSGYPVALTHVDFFWKRNGDNKIYDRLVAGKETEVECRFILTANNSEDEEE
jgi:hypothetical protein